MENQANSFSNVTGRYAKSIFQLDNEKKIIGKKLNTLSLAKMLEHLEEINIEYSEILEQESKKEKERIENSKKNNDKE